MAHTTEILPEELIDSRTRRAKRQWEEAWSNPIAAKQNWQRFALLGQTGPIGKNTTLSFVGSELIQS